MRLYDFATDGKECFKRFKKANKIKKLTPKIFKEIIHAINEEITDGMIEHGHEYKIQHGLGTTKVRKFKPAITRETKDGRTIMIAQPDWKATRELWERNPQAKEEKRLIRHTNIHTKGFVAELSWFKSPYMLLPDCWEFVPSREFKEKMSSAILKRPEIINNYELRFIAG